MDKMRGVAGHSVLLQEELHPQLPVVTQAYADYAMCPPLVSVPSELSFPMIFYVGVACGVCFLLSGSIVAHIATKGAQLLRFAPLKSFRT